ncbi:MAG: hypothetical protein J5885_04380 [Clostridia bacterium]|nr:hypothetical protein [Clostridia bacterium]
MKITIRNPETFGTFSFPCGDGALENLMKQFYPQAIETRTIPVHEFVAPKEFAFLNGQKIDLDELNFLAKFIDQYDNYEDAEYLALIRFRHPESVKDLINLSEYKERGAYVLIRDVSNPYKVGYKYCLNTHQLINPDRFSDDELTEIGRKLLQSGKGIITEYGILFPNEEELCADEPEEPFYNGKTFPEYYYDSYLAGIKIHYGDADEYLYFPDDETAIVRALRRVGADEFGDCGWEIETLDSGNPKLDQYLEDILREEGVYAFSRTCRAVSEEDHPDTLAHIIEYTGRTDSESIIALAENTDLFYVSPEVWDDENLVCEWMEEHDISCDPGVRGYIDTAAYAKAIREMTNGKILEDGCFVGVMDPEDLEELFPPEQDEDLTMGGLS